MKHRRSFRSIVAIAALGMVAVACSKSSDTSGSPSGATSTSAAPVEKIDVTVYGQGAWTGPYNYLVVPSMQGAKMAFDALSADPTFPATITFKQADTQGDPANVPPVVDEIVSDPNTVGVVGPGFSGESEASGDTFEQAGIPFVTPSATNPAIADHAWTFWYRAVASDATQAVPAGEYLANVLGAKNVYVTHDKSTYGQGLAEIVRDTLTSNGVNVVGFEGIEPGSEDFSALISNIQNASPTPDAVFFGGYDADFGKIVKQARGAGLTVPMMSGDGSVSSTLVSLAGNALTDVFLTCPCNLGSDFVQQYNAAYGGDASTVPVYVGEGYDVASMYGNGIKQAIEGGATTPEEIRTGIKTYLDSLTTSAPFVGVAKSYAFDPATHELAADNPLSLIYIYKAQPGSITAIGPADKVLGG